MNKIYFVLPAYNEEENIEETIKQWYPVVEKVGSDSRLVIANDGSKDGTLAVLNSLKSSYPQLIVRDLCKTYYLSILTYTLLEE